MTTSPGVHCPRPSFRAIVAPRAPASVPGRGRTCAREDEALLRGVGLTCLVVVAGLVLLRSMRTTPAPEYGSEEYRKMFPASADPQRFEKAREAQEKSGGPQQGRDDPTMLSMEACERAKIAVRSRLKAPSTAKFPGCVFGANEYEIRANPAQTRRVPGSAWSTAPELCTAHLIAVLVFDKLGVGILRRAWFNLDLIWAATLVATGVLTLVL